MKVYIVALTHTDNLDLVPTFRAARPATPEDERAAKAAGLRGEIRLVEAYEADLRRHARVTGFVEKSVPCIRTWAVLARFRTISEQQAALGGQSIWWLSETSFVVSDSRRDGDGIAIWRDGDWVASTRDEAVAELGESHPAIVRSDRLTEAAEVRARTEGRVLATILADARRFRAAHEARA